MLDIRTKTSISQSIQNQQATASRIEYPVSRICKYFTMFIVIALSLFLALSSAIAQPWHGAHENAAGAAYISTIAVDGAVVYAGTWGGGVYMSADRGDTFDSISNGLSNRYIYSLYVSQDGVYASTEGDGIFRYSADTKIWNKAGSAIADGYVFCIRGRGNALFAGTWHHGLYRSLDGGTTWSNNTGILRHKVVYCLYIAGNALYAGTARNGVYRSTNLGVAWQRVGLAGKSVLCLISAGNTMLAGTWKNGVFRSEGSDTLWEESGFSARAITDFALSDTTVYVGGRTMGIYRSENYGRTWDYGGLSGRDVFAIEILGGLSIAGTWGRGVYFCFGSDTSWYTESKGLDGQPVKSAINPVARHRRKPLLRVQEPENDSAAPPKPSQPNAGRVLMLKSCFKSKALICYSVERAGVTHIDISDANGALVYAIRDNVSAKRMRTIELDREKLGKGVYYISLQTPVDRHVIRSVIVE